MSNIYLKVDLRFSKFKKFVFKAVFGELQHMQISLNFQTCHNLKIRSLVAENVCGFSDILILKEIMTF